MLEFFAENTEKKINPGLSEWPTLVFWEINPGFWGFKNKNYEIWFSKTLKNFLGGLRPPNFFVYDSAPGASGLSSIYKLLISKWKKEFLSFTKTKQTNVRDVVTWYFILCFFLTSGMFSGSEASMRIYFLTLAHERSGLSFHSSDMLCISSWRLWRLQARCTIPFFFLFDLYLWLRFFLTRL